MNNERAYDWDRLWVVGDGFGNYLERYTEEVLIGFELTRAEKFHTVEEAKAAGEAAEIDDAVVITASQAERLENGI